MYSEVEFDLLVDALSEKFGLTPEQIRSAEKGEVAFGAGVLKIKFNTKKKTKEEVFAELTLKHPTEKELIEKDIHFGLFILGTEKHDSRRIDNQLRGRSGRQGDPGVSQFFVAMDDEIMRKMGGDKIQSIARMMLSQEELEDIAFTQSQFTNSIQRAQKQMEGWHFGIRKHLFEYDSVIDKQRTRIYAKRDQISKKTVEGETATTSASVVELSVLDEVKEFVHEVVDNVVTTYTATSPWMYAEMAEELSQIVGATVLESELREYSRELALKDYLLALVNGLLTDKLQSAEETMTLDICKRIYLSVMDRNRVQHIDEMHYLREKVSLYGYAQIDPLVMYKKEAFDKFQRLLFTIKKETLAQVIRFDFAGQQNVTQLAAQIATETNGQLDMMQVLKQVTEGLTNGSVIPTAASPSPVSPQKQTVVAGQSGHVLQEDGDVEVIELDEGVTTQQGVRKDGKLRPNDKVNVQYADGKIEYGVKRKKVKEEVEIGKVTVI